MYSVFSANDFQRIDERDDATFYTAPRLVVHIDERAIGTIGTILGKCIPQDAEILDLMSSWRSHLPNGLHPKAVVGLGMNGTEMAENEQLTGWIVRDLNSDPRLPFETASFDAAINTVSVQYLTRPIEVFAEVRRVLRPGGRFIVIFSNRMFPTKAVRIWRESDEQGRVALVRSYFQEAGGFTEIEASEHGTGKSASTSPLQWLGMSGDPVYVVTARRAPHAV